MPIFKYAKVLVLAPAIGSAVIGIVGLLVFGGVLIAGRDRLVNRIPRRAVSDAAPSGLQSRSLPQPGAYADARKTQPEIAPHRSTASQLTQSSIKQQLTSLAPRKQTETRFDFKSSIGSDQLAFLRDSAGRVADDADGKQRVKAFVAMVAPYAPYHFGADLPLPQVLSALLLNEPQPIEIREGRYAILSGIRNSIHRGRGFLWVDMQEGFALGAIFFDPSNGEPTPTLTVFSRQLDPRQLDLTSVRMSQLPQAFREDLDRWAATVGAPPIMTRYFIGASGEKFVLAHDENFCARAEGTPASSLKGACQQRNAQAALIDKNAAQFLQRTHNASNATLKMIASTAPVN